MRALTVGLAALCTAVTLVSLIINAGYYQAYLTCYRPPGSPVCQQLRPWMLRLELLVLVALVLCVASIASSAHNDAASGRTDPARWKVLGAPIAALALAAGLLFGPFSGGLVVLLYLGLLSAGRRLAGTSDAGVHFLLTVAFGVRVVTALLLSAYGVAKVGVPIVFDDEMAYHQAAQQAALLFAAPAGDLSVEWRHLAGHHLTLLGSVYAVVGPDFTALRLLNTALGTLAVAFVFGITRSLFNVAHARLAAWLVALWPALILWSGTGLRESLTLAIALLVPWLLTRRLAGVHLRELPFAVLSGALAIVVLSSLRWEAAIATIVALLIAAVALEHQGQLRKRGKGRAWAQRGRLVAGAAAGFVLAGFSSGLASGGPSAVLAQFSPRALEYRAAVAQLAPLLTDDNRKLTAKPNESFLPLGTIVRVKLPDQTDVVTAMVDSYDKDPAAYRILLDERGTTITLAPELVQPLSDANVGWDTPLRRFVSGARLLFLPLSPWSGELAKDLLAAVDTVAWDFLLALGLMCAWRERRRRAVGWIVLVVYPPLIVLGLSLASTNLGTALRHRSMLIPWLAMLVVPLVVRLWAHIQGALHLRNVRPATDPAHP